MIDKFNLIPHKISFFTLGVRKMHYVFSAPRQGMIRNIAPLQCFVLALKKRQGAFYRPSE